MQVPTRGVSVLWQIAPDLGSYSSDRALSQLSDQKPQIPFTGLESRCRRAALPLAAPGGGFPPASSASGGSGILGLWSHHSSLFPSGHLASPPALCQISKDTCDCAQGPRG